MLRGVVFRISKNSNLFVPIFYTHTVYVNTTPDLQAQLTRMCIYRVVEDEFWDVSRYPATRVPTITTTSWNFGRLSDRNSDT